MDRIVYEFDIGPNITQTPVAQYVGALLNSFYVKCSLSCNDEILSCGSTDGNAYLFKVCKRYQSVDECKFRSKYQKKCYSSL